MKAMRLLEYGKPLKLMDVDVPKVTGDQVLVRVKAAGVCHSDVHLRNGYVGAFNYAERGFKLPITPGHEVAGTIESLGDNASGFSVGDSVAINPWMSDGTCYYCSIGETQMCDHPTLLGILNADGGFAEYVLVPHQKYIQKIHNLSPVEAAPLGCAGVTTYAAVRKARLLPSETAVVIGAGGGLGTLAIQMIRNVSGAKIIGVDVKDNSLAAAKEAGADLTINAKITDPVKEIRSITGRGADAVIDFNSSEQSLDTYSKGLAKMGRYVMVGLYGGTLRYPSPTIIWNELSFVGSDRGNDKDFMNVISMAENRRIKPMVTVTMNLEEANMAIDNLERGTATGRQVLIP
ncbi:MAG: NAD(P)-dependent alcohol dehydrogenase [Nitrososphaerota archaeon]|jgi:propanol-preferring alcohol dehydrogenase|nr:NAD(P)-dependent alcohol dehydrogenase [Nitrososphaerota archaeon]MDG6931351.1 NAD(P)-dependent alcohol dehydrogenase [Nitrososphaerota archaeon]MDG6933009.1 NAD(P)-dependent alcohol dehydrogenase [Nitrososphaerota archaeon]MDG6935494.1 NAD(P)-dependent alcohol dehydrogenase [Nitrososphaerota archaeon]MDG6943522.1 NAD(P)-dependent alcohol dehydrogenase [Nitrososphaerota archaeon]